MTALKNIHPTVRNQNWVWNIGLLDWVMETQPAGGGGGGGAATIVDGGDVAEGATTDVAVQGDNPGTVSAKLRGLNKSVAAGIAITNANLDVALSTRTKPADQQHTIIDSGTADVEMKILSAARLTSAAINISASGDNTVIAGVALQTIRVHKLFLVALSTVVLTPKDGAATTLTGGMTIGSLTLDWDTEPWFITSVGNAFILNLSAAVQVSGRIYYSQS